MRTEYKYGQKTQNIHTCLYTPYNLSQYEIHTFQILLLKHVHIIIKIKQISIKNKCKKENIQYTSIFFSSSNYTSYTTIRDVKV